MVIRHGLPHPLNGTHTAHSEGKDPKTKLNELRRITSRIHTDFYDIRHLGASSSGLSTPHQRLSSGDVCVKLYNIMGELDEWRQRAPVFAEQRSLYEKPEWYDFMLAKEKLLLVRAAMHLAPRRNGYPPSDLLQMTLKHAIDIVHMYEEMLQSGSITWTRSHFQVIFTAGLSIIHCVSLGVCGNVGDIASTAVAPAIPAGMALEVCSRILRIFKQEMPDAGRFAIVFEMLKSNLTRDPNGGQARSETLREPANGHMGQATSSALDRLQEHSTLEKSTNGIDLLADVANWPGGMDALAAMSHEGPNTALPSDSFYEGLPDFHPPVVADGSMLEWPALTDEMMEQLETGLGEYAWDTIGNVLYPWDSTGWGPCS